MEVAIIIIIYIAIGCFFNGLINEPWQKPSLFFVLLWPVMVAVLILVWLMGLMFALGKKITEKMWKQEEGE